VEAGDLTVNVGHEVVLISLKIAAKKAIQMLEKNHYSALGKISEGDPEKYLKFQMEGSQEGLREAEQYGITKVDEAAAIGKVDYDEVLALRKGEKSGADAAEAAAKNTLGVERENI